MCSGEERRERKEANKKGGEQVQRSTNGAERRVALYGGETGAVRGRAWCERGRF